MNNIELRVRKGSISYKDLSEQLNVNINTVYNWFNKPNLDEVKKIRLINAIEEIETKRRKG